MSYIGVEKFLGLDHQVSPSRWSRRLDAESVVSEHVQLVIRESRRVRQEVPAKLGVKYTKSIGLNGSHRQLDLFGTDLPSGSPIFVYVSGGYWQELSGEISSYPVSPMWTKGVKTVVIDYDRAPGITINEIVSEVIEAMKWVVDYAVENGSSGIALAGHSAGGQLCAMVLSSTWFEDASAEVKSLFKGVFLLSGVFDLKPLVGTYVNDPLKMSEEEADRNSPMRPDHVEAAARAIKDSVNIQVHCIVGENEPTHFVTQSHAYAKVLQHVSQCNKVHFELLPDTDHFNIVENLKNSDYTIVHKILQSLNCI